jgi:hypothetical protein
MLPAYCGLESQAQQMTVILLWTKVAVSTGQDSASPADPLVSA